MVCVYFFDQYTKLSKWAKKKQVNDWLGKLVPKHEQIPMDCVRIYVWVCVCVCVVLLSSLSSRWKINGPENLINSYMRTICFSLLLYSMCVFCIIPSCIFFFVSLCCFSQSFSVYRSVFRKMDTFRFWLCYYIKTCAPYTRFLFTLMYKSLMCDIFFSFVSCLPNKNENGLPNKDENKIELTK